MPIVCKLIPLGLAAATVLPATAAAAPGAVDPLEIAQATRIDEAAPFVSPIGEQVVFWKVQAGPARPLVARTREDGLLGASQELVDQSGTELPREMVFDAAGNGFAAWGVAAVGAAGQQVVRPARAPFKAVSSTGSCGRFNAAAYGPTGQLALACSGVSGAPAPGDRVVYGTRAGIGHLMPNVFSAAVTDPFLRPKVAWGAEGTLAVAWTQSDSPTSTSVRLSVVHPPGTPGANALVVATATQPSTTSLSGIVVLPDGRVVVGLSETAGESVRIRPRGGAPGARIPVAPAGQSAYDYTLDGAGAVHLATSAPTGPGMGAPRQLATRTLAPDGTQSTPVPVGPAGAEHLQDLLVAADGTEHVLLTSLDGARVSSRPPGGAFGAPIRVAGAEARFPQAALTPTGDVLVAWTREAAPDDERVVLGGVDSGAPPALTVASAPALVLAGQPGSFRGRATDAMGLRSLRWDFGDGMGSDAGETEHAYAAPGTYTARLTAVDRAGNATTTERTVRVVTAGAAPVLGPPPGGSAPGGTPPSALDRTAPRLTVTAPRTIRFATLRRRGLTATVRLGEPATVAGALVGRTSRATLRRAGDLSLAERTLPRTSARSRRLLLKPSSRLLGRARTLRLVLRVTATDAAGNRRTVSRSVRVRR